MATAAAHEWRAHADLATAKGQLKVVRPSRRRGTMHDDFERCGFLADNACGLGEAHAPVIESPTAQKLFDVLRCPLCGTGLNATDGGVECGSAHRFRADGGYVDLSVEGDAVTTRTFESFGYEWNAFDTITAEEERYWHWYFADVPLDELRDATALDAGCGKGRFTRFTAQRVSGMVALDGSSAVEAAARNLADLHNVLVVKTDLRLPAVESEAFDFVSCLGVLHHLADPEPGFLRLVKLLRPGGRILIYVYSRPEGRGVRSVCLAAANAMRLVTTRLPRAVLRPLAAPIAGALYLGVVLPGAVADRLGIERLRRLPLGTYRRTPVRALWLDTFDRLSAPLEARYRPSEIAAWFSRAGLELDALREDAGIFALGRRSAAPQAP